MEEKKKSLFCDLLDVVGSVNQERQASDKSHECELVTNTYLSRRVAREHTESTCLKIKVRALSRVSEKPLLQRHKLKLFSKRRGS